MEKEPTAPKTKFDLGGGRHRSRSRAPVGHNSSRDQARNENAAATSSVVGGKLAERSRISNADVVRLSPAGRMQNSDGLGIDAAVTDAEGVSRSQPAAANGPKTPLLQQQSEKQSTTTRSWANVAKAAVQGYSLSFYPPNLGVSNAVNCYDEDLDAADPLWKQCLVGYFVGKKLPFKLVEIALKHLWGHRLMEVKANDQGFFFFHIPDPEFRRKVIEGGPLTVARVSLMLQQWQPMLELKKGEHTSVPVWIRLKNLPYELWSARGISKVASTLGTPLYVDQRTEQLKMISFARVCIELEASKTCYDTINVFINGKVRVVEVEYEWKPISCQSCGVFGHKCSATNTGNNRPMQENQHEDHVPQDTAAAFRQHTQLDSSRPLEASTPIPSRPLASCGARLQQDSALNQLTSPASPAKQMSSSVVPDLLASDAVREDDSAPTHLLDSSLLRSGSQDQVVLEVDLTASSSYELVQTERMEQEQRSVGFTDLSRQLAAPLEFATPAATEERLEAAPSSPQPAAPPDSDPTIQKLKYKMACNDSPTQLDAGKSPKLASVQVASSGSPLSKLKPSTSKRRSKRRGLMNPIKQAEVRLFVRQNSICCIGILETKVPADNFDVISSRLLLGWLWLANYEHSPRGRIWVGWNPLLVDFKLLLGTSQLIHGETKILSSDTVITFFVVYGEHTFVSRRPLWQDIISLSQGLKDSPWIVAGDFNAIWDPSDCIGSPDVWIPAFDDFKECMDEAELIDLRFVGFRFTWSTSSGATRKQRKIDRVLVNNCWCLSYSFSEASFLAPGISDHTSMVVKVLPPVHRRIPFKFYNLWMSHPDFSMIVT
ncbi:hypothetical protein BT93_F2160 [Corymbia citriodora subsp. variegata]|nr:hypothetical protein BT93_F2160 [Corymbia citriodora subsp. variegata]